MDWTLGGIFRICTILPARCRWWLENCAIPFARVNCTSLYYSAEMDSSGRGLRLWKFSPLTLTNFPSKIPVDVTSTPPICRQTSSPVFAVHWYAVKYVRTPWLAWQKIISLRIQREKRLSTSANQNYLIRSVLKFESKSVYLGDPS